LLHGSPWNRLGTTAANILTDLPGSSPVQLLQLVYALNKAGYHLFMFDLRNHGQSASSGPMTFGLGEANDLLGALDYLAGRQDVDVESIGVMGFSVGANTILFTLPRTRLIKAAVAVQPIIPAEFSHRFAHNLLGLFGKLAVPLAELMYRVAGGLRFSAMDPAFAVAGATDTPVLFVQGNGDPWGSIENVTLMAEHTPGAVEPLLVDTSDRFEGYQHIISHPEIVDSFLRQYLVA
jgi:pimeloyl-ACP methyl ester carboxylesterase